MSPTCFPWRAPPPNMYKLKPVLGYRNHDFTKKRAPAWSFIRYIPTPKPKPVVSLSPFQKNVMRSIQGKKKKTQNWGNRVEFAKEGGSSRRHPHQKYPKKKRGKNKKKRPCGDDSSCKKWDKPSDQASSAKDRSKKHPSRRSLASGTFQIAPDDMCDLCFPWAKSKARPSEADSKSSKKLRRSYSTSSNGGAPEPGPDAHSFLVMQPGRFIDEMMICDPHGGILLPSGKKIAMERHLPKLPRPPKEDSHLTNKDRVYHKGSSKSSVGTVKKSTDR